MRSTIARVMTLAALLGASAQAHAQEPDVRNIEPLVMLVVDTSGSMEQLPGCICTSVEDCTNCEPKCLLPNVLNEPPQDGLGHELKKNRWAVTLEALTGKFIDFECNPLDRTAANGMTYDLGFTVPYHQPWKCATGTVCAYPGTTALPIQENNGILDNYLETLRFGLMTFDGEYTYKGGSDLINAASFNDSLSDGIEGMWSYGPRKKVRYPGCAEDYWVNSGGRSKIATEGGLISIGSDNCASPPCDVYELNAAIQESLLRSRPYAGTPIAASLEDLYAHLKNDVADTFASCRKRYGILITDGAPSTDFRELGCDCNTSGPACPDGEAYECPYELAPVLATKLVQGAGATDPKQLDQLFVLGMSVDDAAARAELNLIASAGGSPKNADGNEALFTDSPNALRASLDKVFSRLLNPTSRSVPAFATGLTGTQYQISTGFQVSAESKVTSIAPPWVGLVERRSFICDRTLGEVVSPNLGAQGDYFHEVLNDQDINTRKLWTALPVNSFTAPDLKTHLSRGEASRPCGAGYCDYTELKSSQITSALLGVADTTEHDLVLDWMYGKSNSVRQNRRLADIYHSSPTLVGPPIDEPGDEAYTLFRQRAVVKERPLVMYIGTNDGVLHAFSVEDYPHPSFPLTAHAADNLNIKGGEELWGFVPPMFLGRLRDQLSSHQFMMDGTPVVKDVFFKRETLASDTDYHTVLISGMRSGGNGYVALDVTDPLVPKFLWQFTDPEMGLTYGQPEIVQATLFFAERDSDTPTKQTRAVAILPGGVGRQGNASTTPGGCAFTGTFSMKTPSNVVHSSWREPAGDHSPADHRARVPCWQKEGRSLYFVDVATGKLIKKIFDNDTNLANGITLPSPIVGTPTAYQDAVATIATRGFVMDADGVLWRIDMSTDDPKPLDPLTGWTMRPFHDLFWDKGKDGGETTYERPILSLDTLRQLVVLVGTGDTDNFEKEDADNRVVSLTEVSSATTPSAPEDYEALVNWEIRNEGPSGNGFQPSELVTGAMALFEGQLFIASFISDAGTGNSCDYGRGRLWSVDYIRRDETHQNSDWGVGSLPRTYFPTLIPVTTEDASTSDGSLFNVPKEYAAKNLLIQGLGTTQRLTCSVDEPGLLEDQYFSQENLANIEQKEPPAIWIVAQASQGSQRANSKLGSVQAMVKRSITFSRVTSWATSVD